MTPLSQWFLCPVPTCRRAYKSKSSWTKHLCSVHAHLDFSEFQTENTIVDLPRVSLIPPLDNHNLASLPTLPVGPNYAQPSSDLEMEDLAPNDHDTRNDFEMEDLASNDHDARNDFEMENLAHDDAARDDFPLSDSRSSPLHDSSSDVSDNNSNYHPVISGKFLFDVNHTPN